MRYEKKVKYISLSLCILISLSLLIYFISQHLVVQKIVVEVDKEFSWDPAIEVTRTRVQKKLKSFIGKKFKDISLKKVINIVYSEPRVGSAGVVRLLPYRLLIKIKPRRPLLVWLDQDGLLHPLAIDGTLLPPFVSHPVLDLPIVRGQVFFKKKSLRKMAIAFIQQLPKVGELSLQSISEVKYSLQEDSLYFILSKNSRKITMGNNPQQIKLERILSVLQYLRQQNIKWRVIDMRFSQKIVVSID